MNKVNKHKGAAIKVKTRLMIVCLFMICLVFGCIGEKKTESEWSGTVEQKNGVRVANNPEEPFSVYDEGQTHLEDGNLMKLRGNCYHDCPMPQVSTQES